MISRNTIIKKHWQNQTKQNKTKQNKTKKKPNKQTNKKKPNQTNKQTNKKTLTLVFLSFFVTRLPKGVVTTPCDFEVDKPKV